MGSSIRRTEDARLITGQGRFGEDLSFHGQVHAYVVRSQHPHADIENIDVSAAREAEGVVGVFTGADLARDGIKPLRYAPSIANFDGSSVFITPRPVLAVDRVRYIGEGVAVVVAETQQQARDAGELLGVDYREREAIVGTEAASAEGAALVWEGAPRNTCFSWECGDRDGVDRAFASAHRVARLRLIHNRIVAAPLETRGAIGIHHPAEDRFHLHAGVQDPQGTHAVLSAAGLVSHGSQLRVVVPDVGGGFGMKNFAYPEYLLVLWLAKKLRRPVKWISERTESFLSDEQGRGHAGEVSLAVDRDGRFVALRMAFESELGAYLTTSGSRVSTIVGSRCATGAYAIPLVHVETRGVFTNATPSGSYRGAGKPEVIYMLERAVERAAHELGMDSVELRRRNLVATDQLPYRTAMGDTIDSGHFEANLDAALADADLVGFPARKDAAAAAGRLRGLGVAVYAEHDGLKDGRARIVFDTTGSVLVAVSAQSNGQGHETAFAQIAADQLGVRFEDVKVLQGDTDRTGFGAGTGGSRSITVCGTAIVVAAGRILDKAKRLAAPLLGVQLADVSYEAGLFRTVQSNKTLTLADVARASYMVQSVPPGEDLGLEATGHYGTAIPNFSSGCHVCEIDIDRDTGRAEIVRYTCVDDFGQIVNPMLVSGQMHGGIAQGIGQALYENCVYEEHSGQLLTASFMDYCLPRAVDLPLFKNMLNNTDCRTNPLGVKACGEAGTTAAPPAVMNAIADALKGLSDVHVDMPATPERLWRACNPAAGSAAEQAPDDPGARQEEPRARMKG